MAAEKTPMGIFFENQICLVVEPSKAFLASILACVKSLDLPSTLVLSASKYDMAYQMIEEHKPRILITEYDIDGQNGLKLVELQQSFHEDQSRISMMVSKNSSDSVVAEAAEEQVDTFLLKPFSAEDFKKKLAKVIQNKVNPSEYSVKVREARQLMQSADFEKAARTFLEAKSLNPKPALACYYLGEMFRMQRDSLHALDEFQEGRTLQPLHYKCLTAEFEVLVELKDYEKANELIPVLLKNFPLTPRRLTQVFIAAVYSGRFEYLSTYYEQLVKLDKKSPELIKVANAALFAGGKWYLQRSDLAHAMVLFEKALSIVNKEIEFLGRVIGELLKSGAQDEAQEFFVKGLPEDVGTPAYNRIAFRLDEAVLDKAAYLEKARQLFMSGDADADNYATIVKLFAESGKIPLAEAAITKAVSVHPELRDPLYAILESHSAQKSGSAK